MFWFIKPANTYTCILNFRNLVDTLETADFEKLVPFKPGKPEIFAQFLDKMMGFSWPYIQWAGTSNKFVFI